MNADSPENNRRDSVRLFAQRALPWVGFAVWGLAVTVGMFFGGFYAALGIGGGLILYGLAWIEEGRAPRPDGEILAFAFLLLGTTAFLSLFSDHAADSWRNTFKLASIVLPLSLLFTPSLQKRMKVRRFLMPGALLTVLGGIGISVFLVRLRLFPNPDMFLIAKYNRGVSYAMMLIWPMMGLWATKAEGHAFDRVGARRAALFLSAMLAPLLFTHSRATQVAVPAAIAVWLVASYAPKATRVALGVLALSAFLWPFGARMLFAARDTPFAHVPGSLQARVEIWDFMSYRIMEHPWLGCGLGGSRFLSPAEPHGALYLYTGGPVGHPHNAMTQLWVELGVPGILLGLLFAWGTLCRIGRFPKRLVPFALAAWTTGFVLSLAAYNLWTDSFLAAFALTGFLFGAGLRSQEEEDSISAA